MIDFNLPVTGELVENPENRAIVERYRQHVAFLGLKYHGDILAVCPGLQELVLMESDLESGAVDSLHIIGLGPIEHRKVIDRLGHHYNVPTEVNPISWGAYFDNDPMSRFHTITYLGRGNTDHLSDLAQEFTGHLTAEGTAYVTACYLIRPAKPVVFGDRVDFFPDIPVNPNYDWWNWVGMRIRRG